MRSGPGQNCHSSQPFSSSRTLKGYDVKQSVIVALHSCDFAAVASPSGGLHPGVRLRSLVGVLHELMQS